MAHPIENIMRTTMENLKDMIDVNTVVGDAVISSDGITIIPISKVTFGFVAGGGEYGLGDSPMAKSAIPGTDTLPFAGGTSAGVSVAPIGFLVVGNGQIKVLPATYSTPADRIVELVPQLMMDVKNLLTDKWKQKEGEDGTGEYPPYGL